MEMRWLYIGKGEVKPKGIVLVSCVQTRGAEEKLYKAIFGATPDESAPEVVMARWRRGRWVSPTNGQTITGVYAYAHAPLPAPPHHSRHQGEHHQEPPQEGKI